MKRFFAVLTAALLVLAAGGISVAKAEGYTVKGEVVSIDSMGKSVVIRTEEGEQRVSFQETTEGVEMMKPGMNVEMSCIDVEGKSCAKIIKPLTPAPSRMMEGEVVSIDPGGKAVVIKTTAGEEVKMEVTAPKALMVEPAMEAATTEEMLMTKPMEVEEIKPGAKVKVDCFDLEGKFCANKITVVSPEEAGKPVLTEVVEGEVVGIDSANKSVVIDTTKGQRTLYFQKVTAGSPFGEMKMGTKVRAYCLDVGGKSCIKDITAE